MKGILALAPRLDKKQTEKVMELLFKKLDSILTSSHEAPAKIYRLLENLCIYLIVAKKFDFENFIGPNKEVLSEQAYVLAHLCKIIYHWRTLLDVPRSRCEGKQEGAPLSVLGSGTDRSLIERLKLRFFDFANQARFKAREDALVNPPNEQSVMHNESELPIIPGEMRIRHN